MSTFALHHGDCLEVLRGLDSDSIDAIVTDPPYGLAFMGKRWDYDVPSEDIWRECLRVLKPGGHLLAFAGTRTQHRMAVRIEDAGFEIRDLIAWVYGSGFPKSLDVSKAIDKAAGAEREVVGINEDYLRRKPNGMKTAGATAYGYSQSQQETDARVTAPATPEAQHWSGWGTALKPALEPITMARKPLEGTVAANVLAHGTGGINVDGCRVGVDPADPVNSATYHAKPSVAYGKFASKENGEARSMAPPPAGRWPANLIHDGSDEVVGLFPNSGNGSGLPKIAKRARNKGWANSSPGDGVEAIDNYGDSGSAARFFYCAKASKRDRDEGCEGIDKREAIGGMKATDLCRKCGRQKVNTSGECQCAEPDFGPIERRRTNHHPTVKPTDLMRYLCRLVTPPSGIVLDPFTGSGSTGKAAMLEGFAFVGIEREAEYVEIARARIQAAIPEQTSLL